MSVNVAVVPCQQKAQKPHYPQQLQPVPRGYIRCDFFIVTHQIVAYDISLPLKMAIFCLSKIARDGRTYGQTYGRSDGRTRPLIEMRSRI